MCPSFVYIMSISLLRHDALRAPPPPGRALQSPAPEGPERPRRRPRQDQGRPEAGPVQPEDGPGNHEGRAGGHVREEDRGRERGVAETAGGVGADH